MTESTPESMREQTVEAFLTSVSAKTPTPGGGAVASMVAGLASAIATMVVNFSIGKKKLADHQALYEQAMLELTALTGKVLQFAEDDAKAYSVLNGLWKLDATDPVRMASWDAAVQGAIDAPQAVLDGCISLLELLDQLAGATNRMLDSDLAIAAILADAAARSAAWNIRINLPSIEDEARRSELEAATSAAIRLAGDIARSVESRCG